MEQQRECAAADCADSPRLLLSFTTLNGTNKRLQRLELVVPTAWRQSRKLSPSDISAAGVRAAACRVGRGAGRRGTAWRPADAVEVECSVCPRVVSVQLSARDNAAADSFALTPSDGAPSERYSFAVRSRCTHQVVGEVWLTMMLGGHVVASTTSFSLNRWRKRKEVVPVLVDQHEGPTPSVESSPEACKLEPVPVAVPRRILICVRMYAQMDPAAAGIVAGILNYVRNNVAGFINSSIQYVPGSEMRFVSVSAWESQLALANADEVCDRVRRSDMQLAPASFPRFVILSQMHSIH
eukprot:m51a1_g427 hypothetical protein (296) ;mRNA; r:30621-31734